MLPEAASILWKGGFPRPASTSARRGTQRAIVRLQIELQRMAIEDGAASMILCDRGTLDGLAYWPGEPAEYRLGGRVPSATESAFANSLRVRDFALTIGEEVPTPGLVTTIRPPQPIEK